MNAFVIKPILASMRPRQACLGNELVNEILTSGEIASMRPRQACLGNAGVIRRRTRTRAGFNEAEASLPRKSRRGTCDPHTQIGASMRPRQACLGNSPVPYANRSYRTASMRPRQACLGNDYKEFSGDPRLWRFNEAEASLPRKFGLTFRVVFVLRSFNEAEASLPRKYEHPFAYHQHLSNASMRPRQACLGNVWWFILPQTRITTLQ